MAAAFPDIQKIQYEGPISRNPISFRHYNATEKVGDKTMRDHLLFAVAYWHTMRGTGGDPFGPGTALRPWDDDIGAKIESGEAAPCVSDRQEYLENLINEFM